MSIPLRKCCDQKSHYLIRHKEADYTVCDTHYDGFVIFSKTVVCICCGKIIIENGKWCIPKEIQKEVVA